MAAADKNHTRIYFGLRGFPAAANRAYFVVVSAHGRACAQGRVRAVRGSLVGTRSRTHGSPRARPPLAAPRLQAYRVYDKGPEPNVVTEVSAE